MIKAKYIPVIILSVLIFCAFYIAVSESDSARIHNETFYTGLTPLDSLQTTIKLSNEIENILTKNSKILAKTNFGIGIYSLNSNKWYYSKNIQKPLTPASTTKLFTTFALLKQSGKNFNISTEVYHDGKIEADGILKGNLYIKGKGDALFSTGDLEILADKVRKAGIKKITGNIYADDTFFDEQKQRSVYSGDNEVVESTPPITALNIDRNTATIIVTAGKIAGQAPNVFVMPASDSHIIINNAKVGAVIIPKKKTKRKKSRGAIDFRQDIKSADPYNETREGDFSTLLLVSAQGGIRVTTKSTPDGKQQFVVSGTIRPNSTYTYQHIIQNPAYTIAGAFKNRLKAGGITITGNTGVISHKKDSNHVKMNFVTEFHRPVTDIINIVNKDSDNYLAEILFKILGANAGNYADNAEEARKVRDSIICSCDIDFKACMLNDGSGLSRRNLVTVESMVKILKESYKSEFYNEYKNSVSVASIDGTLRKRFKHTPAEANIHAKTGTLRNVSALSGYVSTLDGEDIAFAFVFNGPNVGSYKLLENELGTLLSEFSFNEKKVELKAIKK